MSGKPTHKLISQPTIGGRYLSDYMAASETKRRSILRHCKYRQIAQLIQHKHAKNFIIKSLLQGSLSSVTLTHEASRIRELLWDSNFEKQVLEINADFLDAYSSVFSSTQLPSATPIVAPQDYKVSIGGVEVSPDIRLAYQRTTKTNKVRRGYMTIRYAKGKPLSDEVGAWQSALLFGCCKRDCEQEGVEAEKALCVTLDAVTGKFAPAPGDAVRRFSYIESACETIAGYWDSITPPKNAVL